MEDQQETENPWLSVLAAQDEIEFVELTVNNPQSILLSKAEKKARVGELLEAAANTTGCSVSAMKAALGDGGVGVNTARASDGMTALHVAVTLNNIDAVLYLLSQGADFRAQDNHGDTPEKLAVEIGFADSKILNAFFDHDQHCRALCIAIADMNLDTFRRYINNCSEQYQLRRLLNLAQARLGKVVVGVAMAGVGGLHVPNKLPEIINVCWARRLTIELMQGSSYEILVYLNNNYELYLIESILKKMDPDRLNKLRVEEPYKKFTRVQQAGENVRIDALPAFEKALIKKDVDALKESLLESRDFPYSREQLIAALQLLETDFSFEWTYRNFLMKINKAGKPLYFYLKDLDLNGVEGCDKFKNIVASEKAANVLSARTSPVVSRRSAELQPHSPLTKPIFQGPN